MVLLYCIILFIIGLWIYRSYPQYILHYVLLWICFAPWIINLGYSIEEEDYWNILTWAVYLSYAIAITDIARNKVKDKWIKKIFFLMSCLVLVYSMLSFFRGTSFISSLKYIVGNTGFLVSLSVIYLKQSELKSLIKLIRAIVYFELALAFIQPFTDLLNYEAVLSGDDVMTSIVNGSFIRNNVFIEFLTPLVMLLVYVDYQRHKKVLLRSVVVILFLLYETYNTGVRTALVAILPIIIYMFYHLLGFFFKTPKSRILAMLLFGLSMYSLYSFVNNMAANTGVTYTQNATDSSERQTVLLSMLNDSDFAENQTTLGLSFIVLSTLPENPLLGPGYLFQGNGYGNFINMEEGNVTDATLAIFICETGLLGLILLLIVYYVILCKMSIPNLLTLLIFIYLFIISIVDSGVFFMGNMLVLFIAKKVTDKSIILR